jgi:hypothetical protein
MTLTYGTRHAIRLALAALAVLLALPLGLLVTLRRRRTLLIGLLVLLGAGGGYWLLERGPVLRTVTVSLVPGLVVVDAATERAFVNNYGDGSMSVLDAHSGVVLRTAAIYEALATAIVDASTNRVYLVSDDSSQDFLLDARSELLVSTIGQPDLTGVVDPRTGRITVTIGDTYTSANQIAVLDGRTGQLLRSTNLTGKTPLGVALEAQAAAGPVQAALRLVGTALLKAAVLRTVAPYQTGTGGVRLPHHVHYVAAIPHEDGGPSR